MIGPDKKVKLILIYPMTTGRNFDEVLRVIDSLQLTAKHKVATPVNWKQGEKVIIAGSVSNDQAKEVYPDGWEEPRPYIRIVPQPTARAPDHTDARAAPRDPGRGGAPPGGPDARRDDRAAARSHARVAGRTRKLTSEARPGPRRRRRPARSGGR